MQIVAYKKKNQPKIFKANLDDKSYQNPPLNYTGRKEPTPQLYVRIPFDGSFQRDLLSLAQYGGMGTQIERQHLENFLEKATMYRVLAHRTVFGYEITELIIDVILKEFPSLIATKLPTFLLKG